MTDDLVRATGYSSADEANATVRELILHGIGATVGKADPSGPYGDLPYVVLVVGEDRMRAREILGLVEDRERELEGIDRARRSAPSLKILVPVMIAAFVLLPAFAFYLSYKASGG